MTASDWYVISNIDSLDSPTLVVYPGRIKENIKTFVGSVDSVTRLRPHIKTHKSPEVSKMMLEAGVKKFKCATIAEAEMLAEAGAPDILLAYQPVGPKAERFASLTSKYRAIRWACLVDNIGTSMFIASVFERAGQNIQAYIDLNVGMNRTGIAVSAAHQLFDACKDLKGLTIVGLHAYDGHLRDTDFGVRTQRCDEAFTQIKSLQESIEIKSGKKLTIVAGGTPTFSIHCKRKEIECSPGTFIYWDKGYEQILQEQHYLQAALVVSRIVSIPADNIICTDLGHKAIAAENPLPNRVYFLNAPELEPIGHSEEHMVFKVEPGKKYKVGDVLYGVPYHICPTVALHDVAYAVIDHQVKENWNTLARKRKLTV
jgi:D-threonine aldolase